MIRSLKSNIAAMVCLIVAHASLAAQTHTKVWTPKGESFETAAPHLLAWWTNNPLRLDASGDLLIGARASDGNKVTAGDYAIDHKLTHLGTIAGCRIVQIIFTITPDSRIIASGWSSKDSPPTQWKVLLAQIGSGDSYIEVYHLQAEANLFLPLKDASVYGAAPNAILGTSDLMYGVGGLCEDGYWWFDKAELMRWTFRPCKKR